MITYRALSPLNRPKPGTERRRALFRVTPDRALRHLEAELEKLEATNAIIELDCTPSQLWSDGSRIKAGARLDSPCVVLMFDLPGVGAVRYPADTFDQWQDNVRALGLALTALRAVDRYGVTQQREQYRGWKALPPPSNGAATPELAARVIAETIVGVHPKMPASELLADAEKARVAIGFALRIAHPDLGGTAEQFDRVQQARRVLLDHHRGSI